VKGVFKSESPHVFTTEAIMLVLLSLMSLKEVFDIGLMAYHAFHGGKTAVQLLVELSANLLDDVLLGVCWAIVGLRLDIIYASADLSNSIGLTDTDVNLQKAISDFEGIGKIQEEWFWLWIGLLFLLVLQLFRYFAFDPRMKVVTDTITRSAEKLLPVLVVFVAVLLTFSSLATLLFGEVIADFKDVWGSTQMCLLVMLGDWDLQQLIDVHAPGAIFFFWTFIVLMMLLVLNVSGVDFSVGCYIVCLPHISHMHCAADGACCCVYRLRWHYCGPHRG
jgi:hypothetical protein